MNEMTDPVSGRVRTHRPLEISVLLVSLVVAVVIGLLAMHTVQSTMGMHGAGASDAAVMMPAAADTSIVAEATHITSTCNVSCAPGATMAAMACILALLTAVLLLAGARAANSTIPPLRVALLGIAPRPVDAGRAQPDLLVLSISRT